jgi:hypothetical protein
VITTTGRRHLGHAILCGALGASVLIPLAGCGKKSPPLAPIRPTPGRVVDIVPRRLGETVVVRVTIPETNLDGSRPVDLDHIEVFAFTALTQSAVRDLKKDATLVGTIQVQRAFTADEEEARTKKGAPPPPNPGEAPGSVGIVTEVLTPAMFIPVTPKTPPVKVVEPPDTGPVVALPLAGPVPDIKPVRYYAAIGVSRKKVRGPNSPRPTVALDAPPPQPLAVEAAFTESAITVTWKAPAEQRLPYQEKAEGDVLKATPKGVAPVIVYGYNVYLVSGGETPPPTSPERAMPLNAKPLTETEYADGEMTFGKERCYVVRAADRGVESAPTKTVCVTPTDRFAPPVPSGLAAVASEGAISLIWEGVEAPDLAGYLVLRAVGPDGELRPLFDAPIKETAFRDATAKPGVRYTYAVASVDTATPRNVSAASNKVEEAAR